MSQISKLYLKYGFSILLLSEAQKYTNKKDICSHNDAVIALQILKQFQISVRIALVYGKPGTYICKALCNVMWNATFPKYVREHIKKITTVFTRHFGFINYRVFDEHRECAKDALDVHQHRKYSPAYLLADMPLLQHHISVIQSGFPPWTRFVTLMQVLVQ